MADPGTQDYNQAVQSNTDNSTSTDLPAWYQQYTQNIASNGSALASNLSSAPLPQQSTAGFNADQTAAFDQVRNDQGVWQQPLAQAADLASSIAPTSAQFNDYAQGAVAAPAYTTGASVQPYVQGGQDAVSGNAQDWTDNYQKYMSPYTAQVTDNIAQLGNQNWNNNIMPGINSSMIGSGQFGSTRNADVLGKSAAQVQTDITGQQSAALQAGYNSGAGIFANDANRIQQQQKLQSDAALQGGALTQTALGADAARIQQQQQLQAQTALTGGVNAVSALNTGANSLGALGQTYQTLNNTDNAALLKVGDQQQALQQTGLNTGFTNASAARTDPWTQINNEAALASAFKLPTQQSTTTSGLNTTVGSGQSGVAPTATDSTASALLALASILGKTGVA
jgi:hypothetical protein